MSKKHLLSLGLTLMAFCSLLLSACGGSSNSALTVSDILDKVKNADIKSGEFSLEMSSSDNSMTGTGTGKFTINPKRVAMDLTISASGMSIPMSFVQDSQYEYTKDQTGTWTKTASKDTSSIAFDTSSVKDAKLIGTETINGTACYHITGTDSSDGSPEEFWIKTDNFYPAKFVAMMKGSGGSPDSKLTMTITAWNTNVTIDIPQV
jgi:Predicted periplasmic protein (DUF2092)